MPEKTLYFQNPRLLTELYCGHEGNLQMLKEYLSVEAITRDDWIRVTGPEDGIEKAAAFFEVLEDGRRKGLRITLGDFRNTLRSIAEGRLEDVRQIFDEEVVYRFRKKSVVPKTLNQKTYLKAIQDHDVVFGIGPAGTGKTYLAVAAALHALQEGSVERIILTRPAVEAGEALGFLPGDLTDKIQPYLMPLYDAIHDLLGANDGRKLLGQDKEPKGRETADPKVEIAPLAYMRGRTLGNAFVVLDEAQNTTHAQMMMFLTRLGDGSRMVITGDKTQIDLPRQKISGLKEAERVLGRVPGIYFHYFDGRDVVRHPLVQRIIDAYAKDAGHTASASQIG